MRYLVTMTNGHQWATDFVPGVPVRTPDGKVLTETIIAQNTRDANTVNVTLSEAHVVTVVDLDCG